MTKKYHLTQLVLRAAQRRGEQPQGVKAGDRVGVLALSSEHAAAIRRSQDPQVRIEGALLASADEVGCMKRTQSLEDAVQELNTALLPLSRRGFLRTGLSVSAGVAAVAVGGVAWLRRSPRDSLPLPAGLSWMSASQHQVFRRLAQLLLPTAGIALCPLANVPVVAHVDALLGNLAEHVRKDLCLGIDLFDNAAVAGHWARFVDLPDDEALAYLQDWLGSNLMPKRAIAFALTKLTQVAYWMDELTWAPVEYDGPVTRRLGIPALGNHPLPR